MCPWNLVRRTISNRLVQFLVPQLTDADYESRARSERQVLDLAPPRLPAQLHPRASEDIHSPLLRSDGQQALYRIYSVSEVSPASHCTPQLPILTVCERRELRADPQFGELGERER